MGYKIGLIAGAATGYVLGSRAGRNRYEQIKRESARLWGSDPVQSGVHAAADAVKTKAPAATHGLVDKAVEAATPDAAPAQGDTPAHGTTHLGSTGTGGSTGPAIS